MNGFKDMTVRFAGICFLIFLVAGSCFSAFAREAGRSGYDFDFIRNMNSWLTSSNAAGIGTVSVDRTSFAEALFEKADGGLIPVEGSDDSWLAGARTESFVKISDKIAFHGGLSYSYFHGENMGGPFLIDPSYNPVNFVESTEDNKGVKIKETYYLSGGMSYTFNEKWALGANVSYETADYAKRKDPRPRSRWLYLDIAPGFRFSPSEMFSIGMNLQYVRTVETLDGNVFGTTDKQYYTLIDYGGYFGYTEAFDGTEGYVNVSSSSANSRQRPMTNSFYGGSLQIATGLADDIGFFNELTYLRRGGQYGNKASTEVIFCEFEGNVYEYSGILDIDAGSSFHKAAFTARYENLYNYENIYRKSTELGEDTVTEYFGRTETLDRSDFDMGFSYTGYLGIRDGRPGWTVGASLNTTYRSWRATYYPYYRVQEITAVSAALNLQRNIRVSKNIFTVGAAVSCFWGTGTKNEDGFYIRPHSGNLTSNDAYLNRDFEYDTASRMAGTLSFRYTRLFSDKIAAYIDLRDTCNHTLETPEFLANGYRNMFAVAIGCAF